MEDKYVTDLLFTIDRFNFNMDIKQLCTYLQFEFILRKIKNDFLNCQI